MSTKVINLTPDYLEHMDSIEKKIIFDKGGFGYNEMYIQL